LDIAPKSTKNLDFTSSISKLLEPHHTLMMGITSGKNNYSLFPVIPGNRKYSNLRLSFEIVSQERFDDLKSRNITKVINICDLFIPEIDDYVTFHYGSRFLTCQIKNIEHISKSQMQDYIIKQEKDMLISYQITKSKELDDLDYIILEI